jgi:hypothetical protein
MIFQVLHSSSAVWFGGVIVGISYGNPELHSRLDIAFNEIHRVHQPSMNL